MAYDNSCQAILLRYIHILQLVICYEATVRYFPALVYPVSLLADNKTLIGAAIGQAKEQAFITKDYEFVQLLDWALYSLEAFVDDSWAEYENSLVE